MIFVANEVDDSAMLRFAIEGYENTNYADVEVRILLNGAFIEIYPLKNSLGMSAIDFAKRSLELSRKYRPDKKYYSEEKEGEFNGIKTFEFLATGGFEERGKQIEGNAAVNAPDLFEKADEGLSLEVPHKIIYFDYNGMIYRVMYPIGNKLADEIIDSFEFSGTRPE